MYLLFGCLPFVPSPQLALFCPPVHFVSFSFSNGHFVSWISRLPPLWCTRSSFFLAPKIYFTSHRGYFGGLQFLPTSQRVFRHFYHTPLWGSAALSRAGRHHQSGGRLGVDCLPPLPPLVSCRSHHSKCRTPPKKVEYENVLSVVFENRKQRQKGRNRKLNSGMQILGFARTPKGGV